MVSFIKKPHTHPNIMRDLYFILLNALCHALLIYGLDHASPRPPGPSPHASATITGHVASPSFLFIYFHFVLLQDLFLLFIFKSLYLHSVKFYFEKQIVNAKYSAQLG